MIGVAWTAAAAAIVAACLAAAPARAAVPVSVTAGPNVAGVAQVGATLTASGGHWSGPSGTVAGYAWARCTSTATSSCVPIRGAESTSTYRLVSDDQGRRIRALLWALHYPDFDYAYSAATAVVGAAPTPTPTPTPTKTPTPTPTPTKTPTPTPTPTPTKTPTPTPTPTPTKTPAPSPTPAVTPAPVITPVPEPLPVAAPAPVRPAANPRPRMMRPYPLVRISGRLTGNGAFVKRLTVTAPRGAHIGVVCHGAGCPRRRVAMVAAVRHIAVFERALRAGTRLVVTISKPGYITKVTTITIRRGRSPARTDLCLAPGAKRPGACPKT
jgi:hypothetical protein